LHFDRQIHGVAGPDTLPAQWRCFKGNYGEGLEKMKATALLELAQRRGCDVGARSLVADTLDSWT